MIPLFRFLIGTALIGISLAAGGFVEPYPVNSCSGGIAFGAVTCPNQPGCCSGGAVCCAGGCCPITAWCVNYGLPNEGCCPFSDKTNCGAVVPSYVYISAFLLLFMFLCFIFSLFFSSLSFRSLSFLFALVGWAGT